MSEPEEVILDGAHHATTAVAALWRRRASAGRPPEVRLTDVRARLELLTGALFRSAAPIGVAEAPAVPNWFARVTLRIPRHLVPRQARPWTDGAQVRLPPFLPAPSGTERAFARYRIQAVCLSAAALRGTAEALRAAGNLLVRDLYLISEAFAVDAWLRAELPGLEADLAEERRRAAGARPAPVALTLLERRAETLALRALAAGRKPEDLHLMETPADSLAWARTTATSWLAEIGGRGRAARYRGLPPVAAWGTVQPAPDAGAATHIGSPSDADEAPLDSKRVRMLARRPRVRRAPEDEDDERVGMWMVQIDDPQESVEDPMGLQRPTDRDDDVDPGGLADSLSELPEARLVPAPGTPKEVLASEDPPPRGATAEPGVPARVGVAYPEWDFRTECYHPAYAVVRERDAAAGDPAWAERALTQHAREVQRVRRRFERLRARRVRLRAQTDGDPDIEAYVSARADRRAGGAAEDRLYENVRPARRDIAILLLVDVSGSTDSWVADARRIVDVEKEALLVVCEALDALGDGYAVMAFSGEGARGVSMARVKSFGESNGVPVKRRIAALEPDRFTRTGAALRHATASLVKEQARHRLLLVLSDGKPNDVDVYEGRYGVEDTRQAVAEARLQGLHPFCVTVDRHAPIYLPRVFGPRGYAVLRHPAALPHVLADVIRTLLCS